MRIHKVTRVLDVPLYVPHMLRARTRCPATQLLGFGLLLQSDQTLLLLAGNESCDIRP